MSADPLVLHGLAETFVDDLLAELPALAVEVAASTDAIGEPGDTARAGRALFRSQLVHRVAEATQSALEAELEDIRQEALTGRRK